MSLQSAETFRIFPLGESAATIELGIVMDELVNKKALALGEWFNKNNIPGIKDVVVAYSSLTLFYDPYLLLRNHHIHGSVYSWIEKLLVKAFDESEDVNTHVAKSIRIPVCYDAQFGIDQQYLSEHLGLSADEIIQIHYSRKYRVYMLGFVPGFGYLGELDHRLIVPRKPLPVQVAPGSVAIASNQTAIYPITSPGGWHIIGRTPMGLFDPNAEIPVKLQAGDEVEFYPVSIEEFGSWEGN